MGMSDKNAFEMLVVAARNGAVKKGRECLWSASGSPGGEKPVIPRLSAESMSQKSGVGAGFP